MANTEALLTGTLPEQVNALEVRGVQKHFGSFAALQHVDLAVRQGEMLCLLGPSGCGKTTLLRIIAGLEVQSAGRLYQHGRDISTLAPAHRDYGIVFQSYALFPNLSVADNISYGLVSRRAKKSEVFARVQELLTLVGLPGSGDKYPNQLSGGQQQRVALARALASKPGLLLLDEPLSALDAIERVRLRAEIRRLQQHFGITTILVTHDQEEALSMADRVVVMNHGVIEQIGTPQDIYESPATPFVAAFVGKVNILRATALGGTRFRLGALELDCAACRSDHPTGTLVDLYLRPEDCAVDHLTPGTPAQLAATVRKIEFLGGSCLAELSSEALGEQTIHVQFSLNQMRAFNVVVGAPLRVALRAQRLRSFSSTGHQ